MVVSPATNRAARTALGSCFGALLTLWQPLRSCFSLEVQPLLPTSATMAIFCAGRSLEESTWLSAEAFIGTCFAVVNAEFIRWLSLPLEFIPTDSLLSGLVILEATAFVAAMCCTPTSESTKMYCASLTAYFVMSLFSATSLSVSRTCFEYLAISVFGSLCLILAYIVPIPYLPNTRGLRMAEMAFEEVADECADVITEATTALLGSGAGEAWRSVARGRLGILTDKLNAAREAVSYVEWSPAAAIRRLTRKGRRAAEARRVHREAAFHAAAEAIDTCRLLCELAISAHSRSSTVGAAAVQIAAAACLGRVSENAASLLRDFARTNFRRSSGDIQFVLGDDRRLSLRKATRVALRNSSIAARELLLLGQYTDVEDTGISKRDFAQTRSDLAAFTFLVHGLAADLLRTEGAALKAAREAASDDATEDKDDTASLTRARSSSESDLEHGADDEEHDRHASWKSSEPANLLLLEMPLLNSSKTVPLSVADRLKVAAATAAASANTRVLLWVAQLRSGIVASVRQRWRIALKVSLSYFPSFCASVYLFGKDSTVVSAASLLCSYGSQYDGGSLRRSVSRIVGVAAGASFGSALEQMFVYLFAHASWLLDHREWSLHNIGEDIRSITYQGGALTMSLGLLWGATFSGVLLCFRGGPHSYAGFCAGFTAAKFLLCSSAGCTEVSTAITYNMYAASLAVAVEMGVLPIYAGDLLRVRLSGSLLGAAAALSSLVTSEVSSEAPGPVTPNAVGETLKATRESMAATDTVKPMLRTLQNVGRTFSFRSKAKEAEAAQLQKGELPDLTERLKRAGILDKYVAFRDNYMKWRSGDGAGARGELSVGANAPADGSPSASVPESIPEDSPVHGAEAPKADLLRAQTAGLDRQESGGTAGTMATIMEGFAPPSIGVDGAPDASLDPFAAVRLPTLERSPSGEGDADAAGSGGGTCKASSVMLDADYAFVEGMEAARDQAQNEDQVSLVAAGLEKHGVLQDMPRLQELFAQTMAPEPPQEERSMDASPSSTTPSSRWQKTRRVVKIAGALRRSGSSSVTPSQSPLEPAPTPTALAPAAGRSKMSLARVQLLLDEIDSALAPAADLAAQAGERLDAERVDTHMWRRLAGVVGVVRLRLSLLARIALRLQHGVSVPELMGGEEAAGRALVEAFGGALAVATAAVAGGAAPKPRTCAELEARLRASSDALCNALARRRPPGALARTAAGSAEVTAEVLAGTAGHTLTALLSDAAELLGYACALAGAPATGGAATLAPAPSTPKRGAADPPAAAPLALPDLTERLKEAGTYDQYLQWREGYMKWRGGGSGGAKGEIAKMSSET